MSALEKPVLIVGSGLEAHLALRKLVKLNHVKEVHYLTTERSGDGPLVYVEGGSEAELKKVVLKNVWGKSVFSMDIPHLSRFREETWNHDKLVSLPKGVTVNRVARTEEGFLSTFSDGTELLCSLVVFCDGFESRAKTFWTKLAKKPKDRNSIRCWGFRAKNYESLSQVEFRWAAAKSMELIPEGEDVWVNLRFKSAFGTELSVAELKSLFAEFGSDVEALFEGLADEDILFSQEESISAVFCPAPGCLSLGPAAWVGRRSLPFHWTQRFVDRQLKILGEQLEVGSLNFDSFEAQSNELLRELDVADAFFRRHLNSDNILLRPFRNLLLAIVPKAFWVSKLRQRLWLD